MRTKLFLKIVIVLPLLVFADYLVMSLLGCISCLFGFGESYFCGTYCLLGKIILALSALFFIWYIYGDLKALTKKRTQRA